MKKENFKSLTFIFLSVLVIILIFTFFDYLVHLLREEYAVPSYYFRNKIIFGTLIGFITCLFVRKKSLIVKSLIFSFVVAVLLQIRYYLEGYPKDFVFLFLVIHFLILLVVFLVIFKLIEKFKL